MQIKQHLESMKSVTQGNCNNVEENNQELNISQHQQPHHYTLVFKSKQSKTVQNQKEVDKTSNLDVGCNMRVENIE